MRKSKILPHFFYQNSMRKILVDMIVVIIASVFVFGILPEAVTFFSLASSHTTFMQKLIHSVLACVCVFVFRILLMVYKQPWDHTKTICFIHIIVADAMAFIVFYVIAEFALKSVYPFLLELSLFALIDIITLFYRLFYKGLSEEYKFTEQ
jgi:FlaA1/EpsC-like NDP-sugar epimerase